MNTTRIITECCAAEGITLDARELFEADLRAQAEVECTPINELCRRLVEYAEDELRRARKVQS